MFSFLPRVTQTCLSKKLYSQKTLSFPPTLTVLPHSQSAHSKKLNLSLTPFHLGLSSGHSLSDLAPSSSVSLTHSLSAAPLPSPSPSPSPLHLAPSQSQLRSLPLIPSPSFVVSFSVTLLSASPDIHFNSLASLVFVNFSLHLLINCNSFFLVLIECWNDGFCTQRNRASLVFVNFWSIAIHFFLFLLSWNAHKEIEFKAIGF